MWNASGPIGISSLAPEQRLTGGTRAGAAGVTAAMADSCAARFAEGEPSRFALATAGRRIAASGVRHRLEPGPAHTLTERVRRFFAAERSCCAPELLVGALPFDRMADDFLFQPETLTETSPTAAPAIAVLPSHRWRVRPEPTRTQYQAMVGRALQLIAGSRDAETPLSKIVLSRSLLLQADADIDLARLYNGLRGDPGAVRFMTPLGPGADGRPRHLVGATPELLLRKTGAAILSHPLAGSARRSSDAEEDRAAADGLVRSMKDQREHRWVVEAILDGLAPYCTSLSAPQAPTLVSTRTMWHLGTMIEGRLKNADEVSSAELAAVLHPTPAVGGTPRDQAMALIPELEGYDRGFYAGAVGWTDRAGDGDWFVSLRCAEVSGPYARVYAGAGIVQGSDPAEEVDETSAKLQAILRALGVEEEGLSPMPPTGETAHSDKRIAG